MPSPRRVYLDHNASTPLAPEVAEAMRPFLREAFGNPSSGHWAGRPARVAVEASRRHVALLLGCAPGEVILTSGGTESNNAALKGSWFARGGGRAHIVTSAVEHPAVLEPCRWLESQGAKVTRVAVDGTGRVDPEDVARALTPATAVVSVMHAQNEVGTVQPIAEIGSICRRHGVPFHCDAAQSVGKIPVRVEELGVDLLTVAGHKFGAPKGVGALYVRAGTPLVPLLHGASHEGGRRAGTESALLAIGLGAACALAASRPDGDRVRGLRDRFWQALHDWLGDRVERNGHPTECLPNTLHVSFRGVRGADLLGHLPEVAASTGSACHAGGGGGSPALEAMGLAPDRRTGAVRWSLGRSTTEEDLDYVLERLRSLL